MNRITWVAVVCGAATTLVLSNEVGGAEPAFRDVLRGYLARGKNSLPQTVPANVIALEYSVHLRRSGIDEPVDPERYCFQPGDRIRVRIQPLRAAYIYVFLEDEAGRRQCLVPKKDCSAQLATFDQPVDLPTDGSVFEIGSGFNGATLMCVGSKEPDDNLSALRKAAEERTANFELQMRSEKTLTAIQNRQSKAIGYHGPLSSEAFSRLWVEMDQRGAVDAVLVEPPSRQQPSTMAMLTSKSLRCPKLFMSIPLRPAKSSMANVPWHTRR